MKRRLPPVQFDAGAAAKWERLVKAARAAALAPTADPRPLGSAAMKASKAASIPGQHTRESEALQLVLLGQRFASLSVERRNAIAWQLSHYADAVGPYLDAAKARLGEQVPGPRGRADIDQ